MAAHLSRFLTAVHFWGHFHISLKTGVRSRTVIHRSMAFSRKGFSVSPNLFHGPAPGYCSHRCFYQGFLFSFFYVSPNVMVTKSLSFWPSLYNMGFPMGPCSGHLKFLYLKAFLLSTNNYQPSEQFILTIRVFFFLTFYPLFMVLKCSEDRTPGPLGGCNKELIYPEGKSGLSGTRWLFLCTSP